MPSASRQSTLSGLLSLKLLLPLAAVGALLIPSPPIVADEAGDRVRTALLNEDFATARSFLQQVTTASERNKLAGLVDEAEAQALADEVTRHISSGAARLAVAALEDGMPELIERLPIASPGSRRLKALYAIAQQLAAGAPATPLGIPADVSTALAEGRRELEALVGIRAKLLDSIKTVRAEAVRVAGRCVEFADSDRVTDAQNAMAELERQFVALAKLVDSADVTMPPAEADRIRDEARALLSEQIELAGFAMGQMSYFQRNFGDARKTVDAALLYAPTSRRLLGLRVKIEEWQSRQRIWGDLPGR